ncbi:MAG: hypothetical protein U9Q04_07395 [Campylobacterota bacterium]|nr:hypothetical protein [Campylobacterota bacterium]
MNINLTPEIQMQIYLDKQKAYTLEMLEKLTKKQEYKPEEDEDKKKDDVSNDTTKKEPFFKESSFGYNDYMKNQNFNKSVSTQNFFSTLSNAGGSVTNNSD